MRVLFYSRSFYITDVNLSKVCYGLGAMVPGQQDSSSTRPCDIHFRDWWFMS
jgi:hypothetical protein